MITELRRKIANSVIPDGSAEDWDIQELNNVLLPIIPLKRIQLDDEMLKHGTREDLAQKLKEEAVKVYEAKEAEFPDPVQIREVERERSNRELLITSGWIISMIWISFVKVSDYRHMDREIRLWNTNSPDLICSMQ